MALVIVDIVPDLTNKKPGQVWVGTFDPRTGAETKRELFYGGLFPADIRTGEEIVFVQKNKRERYATSPPPIDPS